MNTFDIKLSFTPVRTLKGSIMRLFCNTRVWAVLTLLACPVFVCPAAEDSATATEGKGYLPWERGSVKFGGFVAAFDSTVGFGVNNAAGATFNAEEVLDLDDHLTVFRAEAMFRPGTSLRHQLDFTYASYHRDGTATLLEDFNIGDTVFPSGLRVKSVFNFDIIRGTYSYALLQDERMRIALGAGVYAVPLKYSLRDESTGNKAVGTDTTLPLPALALRAEFQLIPKLFLNASIDAMYLEVSDFKGSLLDVNLALEYRPWRHVGFGLGYNGMSVKVEGENNNSNYPGVDFVGNVDVRFSGLMLYGKLSF
jgi:hypothetical protein